MSTTCKRCGIDIASPQDLKKRPQYCKACQKIEEKADFQKENYGGSENTSTPEKQSEDEEKSTIYEDLEKTLDFLKKSGTEAEKTLLTTEEASKKPAKEEYPEPLEKKLLDMDPLSEMLWDPSIADARAKSHLPPSEEGSRGSKPTFYRASIFLLFVLLLLLAASISFFLLKKEEESPHYLPTYKVKKPDIYWLTPDDARLKEVKSTARSYLGAQNLKEVSHLVYNWEQVKAPLREYWKPDYGNTKVLKIAKAAYVKGILIVILDLETSDKQLRNIVLLRGRSDWKVDWESYVGYSQATWFDGKVQTEEQLVFQARVQIKMDNYYNGPYQEGEYICLKLEDPLGRGYAFGYLEYKSEARDQLAALFAKVGVSTGSYEIQATLKMKHESEAFPNQFLIKSLDTIGWVNFKALLEEYGGTSYPENN